MRKAKSLLALVLAMLTLLAFLPTALAEETAHTVTLTCGEHVSVKEEAPKKTTPGQNLVIEYKSDNADFVPDNPTVTIGENNYTGYNLTEAGTDGYRKLTISKEALTGNVTIHLKASGKMYPVKFISEEGTTDMPGKATAAYGSTYTLPQNVPARTGKAFKGWKAGNDDTYQPGGTYTSIPSGGETFTALWEDKAAAILTYENGGYNIPLPQRHTGYVGDKVQAADAPALAGYRFKHWQGSDGKTYAEKAEIELTGNLTLTAVYDKLYDLLLTGEGLTPTTKQAISGEEIALTVPAAPQGKVFTGWKSSADGKIYTDKYIMPAQNVTLTAQFAAAVTVSYNGDADGKAHYIGEEITVAAAPAAQTGKVFAGWKLGDKLYQPGDKLVLTGNTAFTSQFVNEVTITYVTGTAATLPDLKGGAGLNAMTADAPTREGYTFVGWRASWDGKLYAANATFVLPAANGTLTAEWSNVTVTFTAGSGWGSSGAGTLPAPIQAEAGKSFTAPAKVYNNLSYVMTGWRASWDGKLYAAGSTVTLPQNITGNVTMSAEWEHVYYPDYSENPYYPTPTPNPGNVTYYYSIDASCSKGGTIRPDGTTQVRRGNALTVSWKPKSGYAVDAVYIDGRLDNSHDGSYTFRDVSDSHSIYVRFVRGSGSNDTSPKTGDGYPMALVLLGCSAAAGLLFAATRKRRA